MTRPVRPGFRPRQEEIPCLRLWVALGLPALFAFLGVSWLMTVKPS